MTTSKSLFVFGNLLLALVLLATVATTVAARGADDPTSTITSPNGKFALKVTDLGISLTGPNTKIVLGANRVTIDSSKSKIDVLPGSIAIQGDGPVQVNGALVQLNGGCRPVSEGAQGQVTVPFTPGTFPVHGLTPSRTVLGC